jgi:membrane protein required for colicin V production
MTWADVAIIMICLISAAFGVWRGFAKEALSLATWLVAIWLAWRSSWLLEPTLAEWIAQPELRLWLARIVIFVLVLVAGGVIAWLVRSVVRRTVLSGPDRTLGALFGIARGLLIVGLAVIGLQLAEVDSESWWQQAALREYGERLADGIRYYADLGSAYIQEQA